MHFDKSFFISLATHTPERIERFYKRSKKENLSVKLWPGIYGLDVNIKEYQDKGYLTDDFTLHLPGSLGCMLSHVSLWDHINQDPNCDIALIFEDDILFKKNFLKKLKEIPWSDVPEDWDIIKKRIRKINYTSKNSTIVFIFNLKENCNSTFIRETMGTSNIQWERSYIYHLYQYMFIKIEITRIKYM